MAVKLLTRRGFWRLMVMSLSNVIHTLPFNKVAPYLSVPGLGLNGSSLGSVTVYRTVPLPMLPVIFPLKPTEQRASCCRCLRQLGFVLQHWSIVFKPEGLCCDPWARLGAGEKRTAMRNAKAKWQGMVAGMVRGEAMSVCCENKTWKGRLIYTKKA